MNHREAWAEEMKAPSKEVWARVLRGELEDETFKKTVPVDLKSKDQLNDTAVKVATSSSAPKVILRKRTVAE